MSPFKCLTWNEADKKVKEESKREEELKMKLKEHDYSECYCHALKNPPWGGYSIAEQILYEIKQRKKPVARIEPQDTRRSRYSYRYANNTLTGEIIIHEPLIDDLFTTAAAKSVWVLAYPPSAKVTFSRQESDSTVKGGRNALDMTTEMLKAVRINQSARASYTP